MKTGTILTVAALGAAFALFSSKAKAYAAQSATQDFTGPIYDPDFATDDAYIMLDITDDDSVLSDVRVQAFLHMIRVLETGSDTGYDVFYGGSRFSDTSDHPVLTGEKYGVPLSTSMCRAAGYADGLCVSTAAGAYQFIVPTWNDMRGQYPRLPDFSPDSQDKAAVRLLRKISALQAILSDNLDSALRKASTRWASLPYSSAGQNPKSIAFALSKYNEYLGA